MHILFFAHDGDSDALVNRTFSPEHFTIDHATEWTEVRERLERRTYDLALLDISTSKSQELTILPQLRGLCPLVPILVLINGTQMEDSVRLSALGADDFAHRTATSAPELVARARAVVRRGSRESAAVLRVQDLELDPGRRTAVRSGKQIHLTLKEYALLEFLMRNAGSDVTREQIVERAWNLPAAPQTNVVEVYINYLRRKIDGEFERKLIRTVRGTGYRLLCADGSDSPPAKAASA